MVLLACDTTIELATLGNQMELCIEIICKFIYCVRAPYSIYVRKEFACLVYATSNQLQGFCDLQYARIEWTSYCEI